MLNKMRKGDRHPDGETAATVTIFDAGEMTPQGRKRIAQWLRNQADLIIAHGDEYAPRFRGRYLFDRTAKV